ncbi:MAG: YdbH domain-containing protein [Phenylobacterium sp.]|uniref:intermembrane phospholipid transport protein YdbH family protein n=1 Tax=Phenylobacterium sp. TaxID=1871053 RepID=UPI001A3DBF39|nr:YdbH domain-containing protein [Phenylobacterium sp.]MBL8553782.1 YdbH domain-containing protein [Phenylobacterium sp.]
MPDETPAKTTPGTRRPLRLILAVAGVVLALAAGLAWLNRKTLAREALTGWLKSKGVAADAEVEAFGPTIFTARMTLGDPKAPDFAAERVEVRYRPRITGIEVVSVTMRKPVLRATLAGGKLSVGSLDPLVQDFLRRPPPPGATIPRIQIDGGVLTLASDYGPMRVAGDLLVEDERLKRLAATSAPARLKGRDFDVTLGAGSLIQSAASDRFDVSLAVPVAAARFGDRTLADARLTLGARGPYPDLVKHRGEGPVAIRAALTGRRLSGAGQDLEGVRLTAAFDGTTAGWIQDLRVGGRAQAELSAEAVEASGARTGAVRARLTSDDVRWTRRGGDVLQANARLTGSAARVAVSEFLMDRAAADGRFKVYASAASVQIDGATGFEGHGRWNGLGPPAAADAPQMAALKRAVRGFRITAPQTQVKLAMFSGKTPGVSFRAWPERPVRVLPDSGGAVQVALDRTALVRITSSGGGLPEVDARLNRLSADGVDLAVTARRLALGPMVGGELQADGRLAFGRALTFTTARCVSFRARRLEFGANDIEQLAGRLCPTGGPLLRLADGGWAVDGRAEGVAAAAPFTQARLDGGAGRLSARGRGDRMTLQGRLTAARVTDTAPETRFNPLDVAGPISLAGYIWKADLAFRTAAGQPVATALVTHDGRLAIGTAVIDTGMLTFADGGLQPAGLAPSARAVGSPVVGQARFEGRFDWAPEGASSSGRLTVPGLDFTSPAGPVKGLKGEIAFESLAPLVAAPGQQLSVARIQGIVPIEGLSARFSLRDNLLSIAGGEADVGGGKVRVETLQIPLVEAMPTQGVLIFERVQLHDLVEASPFGDKVELDARVSGRVPFEIAADKVRITGGELKAIQPGRISIDRSALTGVTADTAVAAPAAAPVVDPNATFTDFAYQAMENLAFETLDASIASRDDGRLGVLFHIVGKHDPPTKQRIKLTVMDLIRKRFLGRTLPLPSGTGVNLTLDTTLNLDDLLADWSEYQKARAGGSGGVQP